MTELVETLREEHAALLKLFRQIERDGLDVSLADGVVDAARQALETHLARERDELYPILEKAAASDTEVEAKMSFLYWDLEDLSQVAHAFFSQCGKERNPVDLPLRFDRLYALLEKRIEREEDFLFRLYDRIMGKPVDDEEAEEESMERFRDWSAGKWK